jgi:hypothetical protein
VSAVTQCFGLHYKQHLESEFGGSRVWPNVYISHLGEGEDVEFCGVQ